MRAADASDARMLTFAVEAGLHFLRMLDSAGAVEELSSGVHHEARASAAGDRELAARRRRDRRATCSPWSAAHPTGGGLPSRCARVGRAQLVARSGPEHRRRPIGRRFKRRPTAWLDWYDSMYSEPAGPADDAWNPPRLEYALSVGARLSANAADEMTFSATEIDGPIDWSSFDVNTQASLTTAADQRLRLARRSHDSRAGQLPGRAGAALLGDGGRAHRLRAGAGRPDRSRAVADDRVRQQLRERLVRRPADAAGRIGHARRVAGGDRYVRRPQPDSSARRSRDPAGALLAVAAGAQEPVERPARAKVVTNRFFLPPTLSRTHRQRSARGCAVHARRDGQSGLGHRTDGREPDRAAGAALRSRPTRRPSIAAPIRRSRTCRAICCRRRCRRTGFRCCRCRCRTRCSRTRRARSCRG